ncbi:MAG: HAMP domain-containing histidine kinase [Polyangiaceae bacterium]|nr:HAMP domain-containing histidine kinase [Polyangiaceae bacterium]
MSSEPLRLVPRSVPPRWHDRPDCNLRAARPIARCLAARLGEDDTERLLAGLDLVPADFEGAGRWVSLEHLEAFFEIVRQRLGSDGAFQEACAFRLAEDGFGPLRYLLYAASPQLVYERSAQHVGAVLSYARYEIVASTPTSVHMRYLSERKEGRLFCLLRQAQGAALPTVWGLPAAHTEELACLAHGDAACEYRLRWFVRPRWSSDFLGASSGLFAAWAAGAALGGTAISTWLALPLIGALAGRLLETRRASVLNQGVAHEIQQVLREALREETATRRELLALEARTGEWLQKVEEAATERTATMRELVDRLQLDLQTEASKVRGFTHDIRSPLSVVLAYATMLRLNTRDPKAREMLDEQSAAVTRIEALLRDMVENLPGEQPLVSLRPASVVTSELAESVRQRLRALCHGRPLRAIVFATREAPTHVVHDSVVLNRILDNLLTNAVKYTEKGSIMVEISGRPGKLTFKITDTGRGIAPERIERVFLPGGSTESERAAKSPGIGLSVVVQLLDQIGGELEVVSKPEVGTTFWVHLPIESHAAERSSSSCSAPELVARVVHIRHGEVA